MLYSELRLSNRSLQSWSKLRSVFLVCALLLPTKPVSARAQASPAPCTYHCTSMYMSCAISTWGSSIPLPGQSCGARLRACDVNYCRARPTDPELQLRMSSYIQCKRHCTSQYVSCNIGGGGGCGTLLMGCDQMCE